jgi:excisionase family DNA binding protein
MRPDPTPQLLTVRQAAALLNLAESTLRGWLCDRRLRFVKVGRRTMLRRDDLEAYIEAQTVPAEAPLPTILERRRRRHAAEAAP